MKKVITANLLFLLLIPVTKSNGISSVSKTANVSMFCVDLPIRHANHTFCEISTKWIPRVSKIGGIFACVVPTLLSLIFTVFVVVNSKERIEQVLEGKTLFWKYTGYILIYGKLLWDAVDVTLDSYIFYQLEFGQLIDEKIIRNSHVNNSIFSFAVLGSLKIFFFLSFSKYFELFNRENPLKPVKLMYEWSVFFSEDGPELILEYFYIEKYVTAQPPWYLFVRDIIAALISLTLIYAAVKVSWCYNHPLLNNKFALFYFCSISLIGLLMFARVGGAGYQYVTGRLERDCFNVHDGMLLQSPFSAGCLREVDYFIIALSCILLVPTIVSVLVSAIICGSRYFNADYYGRFVAKIILLEIA